MSSAESFKACPQAQAGWRDFGGLGCLDQVGRKVLTFGTSTYHYKSRGTDQAALERRIKEICETQVRFGYRRVHVLRRPEGWKINMKRTRRIYSELGLSCATSIPSVG